MFSRMNYAFVVALTIAAVLVGTAGIAQADLLLSDSFDGNDIGINDNLAARQGGSLATVSYMSFDETSTGVPIRIWGNVIEFGGRVDQFSPDHDFVGSAITSAGGFVVEFDMDPIVSGGGTSGYFSGFAMGRTAAQAATGYAIGNGDTEDTTCDWSIQLRDNGTYNSAGHGSWELPSGVFDPDPTGETYHVKIQVDTSSFALGQAYSISVWVDDNLVPNFPYSDVWDADGTNYITFEGGAARNSSYKSTVDNFSIRTIPEPGTLALLATGLIGLLCYAWRKRK